MNEVISTDEPIIVCGIPKSGTTMVGHLLSHHPDLLTNYDIDVSTMFLSWLRKTMKDHFFFAERNNDAIGFESQYWMNNEMREWHLLNMEYFRGMHISYRVGAPRWGSSSCFTYYSRELLWTWFPKATLLMVARDPRDHWCSFKHLHIVDCKDKESQWRRFVSLYKNLPARNEDPRMKFVEYHDVLRDPTIVFDILGLAAPENYLDGMEEIYYARTRGDVEYKPKRTWQEGDGNPMVQSRVGRWKRDLSEEEIQRCTEALPELCAYYDAVEKAL